ncbi:hypothetical protein [Streptomyces flavidovirens]|uniref:hypothetical protein n=1 Tax=Streptomyces flavidovirens TaxID=67298 RepID=UPI00040C47AC|nr:hypothetical protein [Streptomyces flavidovirens]
MTTNHLDLTDLLWAAEELHGDPQPDDLGSLIAACARTRAEAFGYEVYQSVHFKAAALMQTIALLKPLEHENKTLAFGAARSFMAANGFRLRPKQEQLREALATLQPGAQGVRELAKHLDRWAQQ